MVLRGTETSRVNGRSLSDTWRSRSKSRDRHARTGTKDRCHGLKRGDFYVDTANITWALRPRGLSVEHSLERVGQYLDQH